MTLPRLQRACASSAPLRQELGQLLAFWLCVILLLQGLTAAFQIGQGPCHRHVLPVERVMGLDHGALHALGLPHHHAKADLAIPAEGEAAAEHAVPLLLVAMLAVRVVYHWLPATLGDMPPRHTASGWRSFIPGLPEEPPRS
ncbi:MAG: hypothetical protein JNJ71_06885 [Rubrivivax sp.]|nr:hypothetical protein [Rubrivivax sp.]